MCKIAYLLAICLTSAVATPQQHRIAGGSIVDITQRPYLAVILFAPDYVIFQQACGGTIINNRSILTAAHCVIARFESQVRVRVGSTNASSGGDVHHVALFITHPNHNLRNQNNNIGLVRVTRAFDFKATVKAGSIAGHYYYIADNDYVWALGWGVTFVGGPRSEQLRQVQIRKLNLSGCTRIFGSNLVTADTMCAGWSAGGRGSCAGDGGSPLVHNNVVVGITSLSACPACGDPRFPVIYTRVSSFTSWILINA